MLSEAEGKTLNLQEELIRYRPKLAVTSDAAFNAPIITHRRQNFEMVWNYSSIFNDMY